MGVLFLCCIYFSLLVDRAEIYFKTLNIQSVEQTEKYDVSGRIEGIFSLSTAFQYVRGSILLRSGISLNSAKLALSHIKS